MKPKIKTPEVLESTPAPGTEEKPPRETGGLHPLVALREEVDHLFDHFFSSFSLGPFGRHVREAKPIHRLEEAFYGFRPLAGEMIGQMSARADVSESDGKYKIDIELPGMKESDIDISVDRGTITITGEKREEARTDEEGFHVCERRYGKVMRSFTIPEGAITDSADASFKDGVLSIEMEKKDAPEAKARKIAIKSI